MNPLRSVAIACFLVVPLAVLTACGNRATMEPCQFIEIEDAELEVDLGDVDAERGEIEMVCGDDIVDVTWSQFRQKLRIDPGRYKNNLDGFRRQVTCLKDERSRQELFCGRLGQELLPFNFTYDD